MFARLAADMRGVCQQMAEKRGCLLLINGDVWRSRSWIVMEPFRELSSSNGGYKRVALASVPTMVRY